MKYLKATVVQGYGTDKVMITTDLPEPTYPFEGTMSFSFDVVRNKGPEYVRTHFELEPEIIQRVKTVGGFSDKFKGI